MNVADAATQLGVTPRRVRAMIADGRVRAHRVGRAWVVDEIVSPRDRRPLSTRSWELLAGALRSRTLEDLSGQDRVRTATRIRQLRGSHDPARLLTEWWPRGAAPDVFMDSLLAHASAGEGDYVREMLRPRREYLRSGRDLADVVSSERAIRRLSRAELARAAEVSPDVVRDIEACRSLTAPGSVRRVLRTLEIEPTALPDLALT